MHIKLLNRKTFKYIDGQGKIHPLTSLEILIEIVAFLIRRKNKATLNATDALATKNPIVRALTRRSS